MTAELFGLFSVIIGIISYAPYAYSFWKGETKPHSFSWFLWSLSGFIIYFTQESGGAGAGAWATLSEAVLCTLVCVAAIKWGERKIERSDAIALVLALIAIAVSFVVHAAYPAVILMAVIDIMAFYPTFRKTWRNPKEEHLSIYVISSLSMGCSMMAMDDVNFVSTFNLAFFLMLQGGFIIMALLRRYAMISMRSMGLQYELINRVA